MSELIRVVTWLAQRRGAITAGTRKDVHERCRDAPDSLADRLVEHGVPRAQARAWIDEGRALVHRMEVVVGPLPVASEADQTLRAGLAQGVLDRGRLLAGLVDEACGGESLDVVVAEAIAQVGTEPGGGSVHEVLHEIGAPRVGAPPPIPAGGPRLGRYPVLGRLGAGGMGEVLSVYDTDLGREVAAKVIKGAAGRRQLWKFALEARVTGQLQHPSIVPLHELGRTDEGQYYFTMKRVEGRTLGDLLLDHAAADADPGTSGRSRRAPSGRRAAARNASLSGSSARLPRASAAEIPDAAHARLDRRLIEFLQVMLKVCDALAYAHSKGVIHRDLKPDNIMVGRFGEVQVMDWGLAKVLGQDDGPDTLGSALVPTRGEGEAVVTMDGDVMGTPAYMPPEQAEGQVELLDERADVYAIGAILYEGLAGVPPYVGSSAWAVLSQVMAGPPPAPSERAPRRKVPWELEAVVERAMARRRGARFDSVEALRDDLEAFLAGRLLSAAQYTAWQRVANVARRHARALAAAAVALVSLIGALGYSAVTARRQVGELGRARDDVQAERDVAQSERNVARRARDEAETERNAARVARDEARANLDEARRMGAVQELRSLLAESDTLWWTRLDPLTGRLQDAPDLARIETVLAQIERWLDHTERLVAQRAWFDEARAAALAEGAAAPNDLWTSFRGRVLSELVLGLDRIGEYQAYVRDRQRVYRVIAASHAERAQAVGWQEATDAIAASPRYGHMRLDPQVGLVPLGENPHTGLWEFAVEGTGEMLARSDNGWVGVGEGSPVVLVLIPGGEYRVGAARGPNGPNQDPMAGTNEGPVHVVRLRPYFIARTELTQRQWMSLGEKNPSERPAGMSFDTMEFTGRHPVEMVSWADAAAALARIGLALPSEAQWEAAARGGKSSAFWMGDTNASAIGDTENLADQTFHRYAPSNACEAWTDGHAAHAPVASFPSGSNPFGLFDVLGNVREWCRDAYTDDAYSALADEHGDRPVPRVARGRTNRGGSWSDAGSYARVSARAGVAPSNCDGSLGLRPSRMVTGDLGR